LKRRDWKTAEAHKSVAPFTGAWIETLAARDPY